jgi:hypothetical protein
MSDRGTVIALAEAINERAQRVGLEWACRMGWAGQLVFNPALEEMKMTSPDTVNFILLNVDPDDDAA